MVTTASPIGTSTGTLDNYYYASPGGITYLGNNDATDGVTPLIIPYPQLLFPVNTGQVAGIVGTNLSLGNDTQDNPITGNLNYTIANADFESVSVPAGIFPNALKQVTSTSVSGTDSLNHQTVTVTGTIWLVPGIGTVKEVTVINRTHPPSRPTGPIFSWPCHKSLVQGRVRRSPGWDTSLRPAGSFCEASI